MSFLSVLAETLGQYELDGGKWKPTGRILLIGNGGSATVAAHIANDLNKEGNDDTVGLVPDYATLSCFANDYGWETALREWVSINWGDNTKLIAISSSGQSPNIVNAAEWASRGPTNDVITFTGFDPDNPLRKLGHTNYYVPSHNYGIVECAHLAILHSIVNPGEL